MNKILLFTLLALVTVVVSGVIALVASTYDPNQTSPHWWQNT